MQTKNINSQYKQQQRTNNNHQQRHNIECVSFGLPTTTVDSVQTSATVHNDDCHHNFRQSQTPVQEAAAPSNSINNSNTSTLSIDCNSDHQKHKQKYSHTSTRLEQFPTNSISSPSFSSFLKLSHYATGTDRNNQRQQVNNIHSSNHHQRHQHSHDSLSVSVVKEHPVDKSEYLILFSNNSENQTKMYPTQISCYTSSQNTLSAFVNQKIPTVIEHQRPTSCISPTSVNQHRMLLCGVATTANNIDKTPPHHHHHQQQVHNQQRSANENITDLQPLSSITTTQLNETKIQHSKFFAGHSNTLPPNSTLSSLMANNTFKSCEHQNMNQHQRNHLQHHHHHNHQQRQQQQELRRQISLNHLDKINTKNVTKGNSFYSKNDSKVSLFQQKIRAILSPMKDNHQHQHHNQNDKPGFNKQNESTYRSYGNVSQTLDDDDDVDDDRRLTKVVGSKSTQSCYNNSHELPSSNNNSNDNNNTNNDNNNNNNEAPSMMHHRWTPSMASNNNNNTSNNDKIVDSCLLNTLNKYTVSASTNNLNHLSSISPRSNELETTMNESDHYDLRTVCNKLFANKQYPCLHNTVMPLTTTLNTVAENSTLVSSMRKSSSDNCYRNITPEMNVDKVARKENIYSYANKSASVTNNDGHQTIRQSQSDGINLINSTFSNHESTLVNNSILSGHCVVVKELNSDNSKCPNGLTVRSESPLTTRNQTTPKRIINQGSTLSLNGAEATESVESQDHNYKSSSESGRGTMNSQVEDRSSNNIDLNSPADLTSLDSDQSNHVESESWNQKNEKCVRRTSDSTKSKPSFNKIQRYLVEQKNQNSNDNDLNCNEFKSKISLNEESDSWTSLSDDQIALKKSSIAKSKSAIASSNKIVPVTKHRYQPDSKLKTDFSKPENCLNPNLKQAKTSVPVDAKSKLPPNPHKFIEMKNVNTISYDKCIYSVPDKGKYRNMNHYPPEVFHAKLNETNFQKDCNDDGSISSETNFPDDVCSEYAHEHHDPLRKQLKGIEDMYSELLNMLHNKGDKSRISRKKVFRRNSGRSSVASRTRDHIYKKYRHDYRTRSRSEDNSQVLVRCKRLESQVLTLAKSVSQLSIDIQYNYSLNDQIQNLRHDMEMLKAQMIMMKQSLVNGSNSKYSTQVNGGINNHHPTVLVNSRGKEIKKVDKLKRLFVDEPQPIKQFLKKLGYEKYVKNFETEKIGIAELIHFDEDKLQKIGIPMGPRIRIAQEIKNLAIVANHNSMTTATTITTKQQQDKTQPIQDNFNIYAVV